MSEAHEVARDYANIRHRYWSAAGNKAVKDFLAGARWQQQQHEAAQSASRPPLEEPLLNRDQQAQE